MGTSFGLSWLDRGPNPSSHEILKMVERFSANWKADLAKFLGEDERKSRLNSLVGIRNDVAHGKNQGVSTVQALEYYGLAVDVVDWLAERLEPLPGVAPPPP